jgi:hypothetical protein
MSPENELSERIRGLLEDLLMAEMQRHIPNDERVGILDGAYWVGWEPSDKTYVGVDHELPVLNRSLSGSDGHEIRLGRGGGVLVVTRRGDVTSVGHWIDGTWVSETQIDLDPPA